mgnify:CR=1 FL=1
MERRDWTIAVPWVLSIVTILIGIGTFYAEQRQANRKPFLEEQLDLGFQASTVVATLATTTDRDEWNAARIKFWLLYWGPLSVVEDKGVEGCMVSIGKLVPGPAAVTPDLPMARLETLSYRLSHKVRDMVRTSWGVDLSPLPDRASQDDRCDVE